MITESSKKRCKYCGKDISNEGNSVSLDTLHIGYVCKDCLKIQELNEFIVNCSRKNSTRIIKNGIYDQNMIADKHNGETEANSFTLTKHKLTFRIVHRTKRVDKIIKKIKSARSYLYFKLNSTFEILDSILVKKDRFWRETGNLASAVLTSCFHDAVMIITEMLANKNGKYSVLKLKETLKMESKYVFEEQKIWQIMKFQESGDILEEKFETFDIETYGKSLNDALNYYGKTLKAFKDCRDQTIAHVDDIDGEVQRDPISYLDLKRMYSFSKIAYDAFLYAVAPDEFAVMNIDSNIWFDHLNDITDIYREYVENKKKLRE